MDHAVYQDLGIHDKTAIAGKRNAVTPLVRQGRSEQGADREAHVGSPGFGKRLPGALIFHDLEAVGLHVAGVEDLDRLHGPSEFRDDTNGRRFS